MLCLVTKLNKKEDVVYMDFEIVMQELAALGKERTKKIYMSNGAKYSILLYDFRLCCSGDISRV